jgi:hypothetical protein
MPTVKDAGERVRENRMPGSMRRREETSASRPRRAARGASRRPYLDSCQAVNVGCRHEDVLGNQRGLLEHSQFAAHAVDLGDRQNV